MEQALAHAKGAAPAAPMSVGRAKGWERMTNSPSCNMSAGSKAVDVLVCLLTPGEPSTIV